MLNKCSISGRAHKTVAWFYQSTVHLNTIKTQFVWKHKTRFSPLIVRWDTTSWTFQFSALMLKIITRVLFSDEYRMSCWNNFGGDRSARLGASIFITICRAPSPLLIVGTQGSLGNLAHARLSASKLRQSCLPASFCICLLAIAL